MNRSLQNWAAEALHTGQRQYVLPYSSMLDFKTCEELCLADIHGHFGRRVTMTVRYACQFFVVCFFKIFLQTADLLGLSSRTFTVQEDQPFLRFTEN